MDQQEEDQINLDHMTLDMVEQMINRSQQIQEQIKLAHNLFYSEAYNKNYQKLPPRELDRLTKLFTNYRMITSLSSIINDYSHSYLKEFKKYQKKHPRIVNDDHIHQQRDVASNTDTDTDTDDRSQGASTAPIRKMELDKIFDNDKSHVKLSHSKFSMPKKHFHDNTAHNLGLKYFSKHTIQNNHGPNAVDKFCNVIIRIWHGIVKFFKDFLD